MGPRSEYETLHDNRFHYLVVQGLAVLVPECPKEIDDSRDSRQDVAYHAKSDKLNPNLAKEGPPPVRGCPIDTHDTYSDQLLSGRLTATVGKNKRPDKVSHYQRQEEEYDVQYPCSRTPPKSRQLDPFRRYQELLTPSAESAIAHISPGAAGAA